jgi:hypothetical protein
MQILTFSIVLGIYESLVVLTLVEGNLLHRTRRRGRKPKKKERKKEDATQACTPTILVWVTHCNSMKSKGGCIPLLLGTNDFFRVEISSFFDKKNLGSLFFIFSLN